MNWLQSSKLLRMVALVGAVTALQTSNSLKAASAREDRAFAGAATSFQLGFWARADGQFDQFVTDYPKSERRAEAILLQAQARYQLRDNDGAVQLLMDNMDRAGPLADAYQFWIAEAQLQKGNNAAAAEAYSNLVTNFPYSPKRLEATLGQATALSRLDQPARVVELLTKQDGLFASAVKRSPTNEFVVRGLLLLGEAQLTRKDFAAAEATLDLLAGQHLAAPLDWRVQQLRCHVLLKQNRTEEAWQTSTNLPALAAASTQSRAQLLAETASLQAEILERLNRLTNAIAVLQVNITNGVPVERQREALLKIAELQMALANSGDARLTLNKFLLEHTNAPAVDAVYLALGELDLKQYAASVPMSTDASTNAIVTNRLQRANAAFDDVLQKFPDSPLRGRALLDKGWCLWLAADVTNSLSLATNSLSLVTDSLSLFEEAAEKISSPEQQAIARFKWADAQLATGNPSGALTNYNAVIENYADLDFVKTNLLEQALYQSARAALQADDMEAASNAVAKMLDWFPNSSAGGGTLLLVGQGYTDRRDSTKARELFDEFLKRRPESPLVPQVRLAIARSYEQEGEWQAAITNYDEWLGMNTTNAFRPHAEFYRAWATYQAGQETNALTLFTNFVVQYPDSDVAPAAQLWIGDYYFHQPDFVAAEKNYKKLFQSWPTSPLAYEARMMAGRAALAWGGDAISYFTNLTSDLKCPPELWTRAMFAYGSTLMSSADTNRQANLVLARDVFNQIVQANPTNENAAMAWGEIGNCYLQLAVQDARSYTNATNAYFQAINVPAASAATRSKAQVGIGQVLEKMAALETDERRTNLLNQALSNYLDVFEEINLRDGETRDLFSVKEAGLKALPFTEMLGEGNRNKFIDEMEKLFPYLKPSLEKKRITLAATKD